MKKYRGYSRDEITIIDTGKWPEMPEEAVWHNGGGHYFTTFRKKEYKIASMHKRWDVYIKGISFWKEFKIGCKTFGEAKRWVHNNS